MSNDLKNQNNKNWHKEGLKKQENNTQPSQHNQIKEGSSQQSSMGRYVREENNNKNTQQNRNK